MSARPQWRSGAKAEQAHHHVPSRLRAEVARARGHSPATYHSRQCLADVASEEMREVRRASKWARGLRKGPTRRSMVELLSSASVNCGSTYGSWARRPSNGAPMSGPTLAARRRYLALRPYRLWIEDCAGFGMARLHAAEEATGARTYTDVPDALLSSMLQRYRAVTSPDLPYDSGKQDTENIDDFLIALLDAVYLADPSDSGILELIIPPDVTPPCAPPPPPPQAVPTPQLQPAQLEQTMQPMMAWFAPGTGTGVAGLVPFFVQQWPSPQQLPAQCTPPHQDQGWKNSQPSTPRQAPAQPSDSNVRRLSSGADIEDGQISTHDVDMGPCERTPQPPSGQSSGYRRTSFAQKPAGVPVEVQDKPMLEEEARTAEAGAPHAPATSIKRPQSARIGGRGRRESVKGQGLTLLAVTSSGRAACAPPMGYSADRPSSADLLAEAKLLNQMHRSCLRRARPTSAKNLKHRRVADDGADSIIYEDVDAQLESGIAVSLLQEKGLAPTFYAKEATLGSGPRPSSPPPRSYAQQL
mmetsp:Transcript_23961/g.44005  ORF Transcript_23961/g.44005 Transcript_23961/m.44005 type:complete len:527 (-) Transcript_23961:124-1704(-)